MGFQIIESKRLFNGKMLKVWLERVLYPDGRQVNVEVIHHPGSVGVLPIDSDGNIWFISQYRHPVGGMLIELPAGTLNQSESPMDCAEREIREEIGMGAKVLEQIGSFYIAPGYSNEIMTIFLARELYISPLDQDHGELINTVKVKIDDAYKLLNRGEIKDAKTAALLGIARDKIMEDLKF